MWDKCGIKTMPIALEGTTFKHPNFDNVSLFAQPIPNSDRITWYTRISFTRENRPTRSLKLPYIPGDEGNKKEALEKALKIYYELDKRHQQGLSNKRTSILKLLERYKNKIKKEAEENDIFVANNKTPPHKLPGGKTPLDQPKYRHIEMVIDNMVAPFFETKKYNTRSLDSLTRRDIEDWSLFRLTEVQTRLNQTWANGTLNKQNRVLRAFLKWAVEQGYIIGVPEIKDFKEDIRASRRPEMTAEQYTKLLKYVEKEYCNTRNTDVNRVYMRFFYLYLATIDSTGIRPFNSPKNAIKKEDVKIKRGKGGDIESILIRRREKGKEYDAVADRQWADIYDDIMVLHKAWNIDSEYLFAHPYTNENMGRYKNAPIGTFNTQWNRAMQYFGWAKKGDKQQDRISKYSIRHRYVCRRYLHNKDITLEELAQVTGSSPSVLYAVYWHYKAEKNYARLMSSGYETKPGRVRLFDSQGIRIDSAKIGSKKHIEWYAKHPEFTEKPK